MASNMMVFAVPDPKVVQAIGLVAVRHAQLDYVLRMMIKSLAGVSVNEALDATARSGSAALRSRITRLARKRLGEGNSLIRLQATLKECERATAKRNDIMHSIVAREVDSAGGAMMRNDNHQWKPLPTEQELDALVVDLARLSADLNEARLLGYLKEAMDQRPVV